VHIILRPMSGFQIHRIKNFDSTRMTGLFDCIPVGRIFCSGLVYVLRVIMQDAAGWYCCGSICARCVRKSDKDSGSNASYKTYRSQPEECVFVGAITAIGGMTNVSTTGLAAARLCGVQLSQASVLHDCLDASGQNSRLKRRGATSPFTETE